MKVRLEDSEIRLNPEEASLCRKKILGQIQAEKNAAVGSRSPTWFFTYLIMMHAVSGRLLRHFDAAQLSDVMEILNGNSPN